METKKDTDSDRFVGKVNARVLKTASGPACNVNYPIELILVTPDRIEGREFVAPPNTKLDWDSCTYPAPSDWLNFAWIPVN
jgi:hypothetical protein